jgi:hypothetical protein
VLSSGNRKVAPLFRFFQLFSFLRQPALFLLLVFLLGHALGLDRSQPQIVQDSRAVARVVADAELALDQRGHAFAGPQVGVPAVGVGALGEEGDQLIAFLGAQFGGWALISVVVVLFRPSRPSSPIAAWPTRCTSNRSRPTSSRA